MERKYELTDETKEVLGRTLHRIVAVRSFGNVKAGDKGGWIEKESNLCHCDNCWVGDHAMVFGNAQLCGNAQVYGNAQVFGDAKVFGDAQVFESAIVSGKANVYGDSSVCGNAKMYGNAEICGQAKACRIVALHGNAEISGASSVSTNGDYIVFKNWWSSGRYFTWTRSNNKWKVGCFLGTGDELIRKAYEDSKQSGREYERIVRYVDEILKAEEE